MGWEDPTYIEDFNTGWPLPGDLKSQGDDHLRSIKSAVTASFPNTTGAWSTTDPVTVGEATDPAHAARLEQLPTTLKSVTSWGVVESTGTNPTTILAGSGDYTITRSTTGRYYIDFAEAASSKWDQTIQLTIQTETNPEAGYNAAILAEYSTTTRIEVWTVINGNAEDGVDFVFTRVRY